MLNNLFIFAFALFAVGKGATLATRYAARLSKSFGLSKYAVGFIVVAFISILPETLISVNAALAGIPSFGLGMLLGSNVADLTIVFAGIVFLAGRSLKIESRMLKNQAVYPFILLIPLILGLNGHYSRLEGAVLIICGAVFYYLALKEETPGTAEPSGNKARNALFLLASLAVLLIGSHFTVTSASALAALLGVNPVLVGMLVVGIGTTMPEFFFSLNAAKRRDDSLAVGDILGTVLSDATIVIGIIALISPFSFPTKIIYITGAFMVAASFVLLRFMRTGRSLTRREGAILFGLWILFVIAESVASGR